VSIDTQASTACIHAAPGQPSALGKLAAKPASACSSLGCM
jgi:hypothetical protein